VNERYTNAALVGGFLVTNNQTQIHHT